MIKMAALFFLTAVLYAAVGFGGGSTYSALLVLVDTNYLILPSIALICNVIVVTGGTWRFHKQGYIAWQRVWPLFVISVPFAWLGGRIQISETVFVLLLGAALLIAGLMLLLQNMFSSSSAKTKVAIKPQKESGRYMPFIGSGLGFLSGVVGIGGGIFLAPILHLSNWGRVKAIAGVCSAFILVNSLAGLLGQLSKLQTNHQILTLLEYWPLFIAVFIGGQIGSTLGSTWLNPKWVRIMTSLLILFVAIRLLLRSMNSL